MKNWSLLSVLIGVFVIQQACSVPNRDNPMDPRGEKFNSSYTYAEKYFLDNGVYPSSQTNIADGVSSSDTTSQDTANIESSQSDSSVVVLSSSSSTLSSTVTPISSQQTSSSSELIPSTDNFPPVIYGDSAVYRVEMSEDRDPVAFQLYLPVTDSDLTDILTWSLVRDASHGKAVAEGSSRQYLEVDYIPDDNYYGLDTFVVIVSDGKAADTALVEVTITPVNDYPRYVGQAEIVGIYEEENTLTLNSGGSCFDIEGDVVFSYTWYRDDDSTGKDGVLIGADSKTYRTQSEDVNFYLYGIVSCVDETGKSVVSYSEYTDSIKTESLKPQITGFSVLVDDSVSNGYILGKLQYSDPNNNGVTLSISGGNDKGIFAIDGDSNIVVVDKTYLYFYGTSGLITLEVQVDDGASQSLDTVYVTLTKIPFTKLINDFNHAGTWNNSRMVYAAVDEFNPEMIVDGWFNVNIEYAGEVFYLHKAVGVDSASLTFAMPDVRGMSRIIIANLGKGAATNAWHLKLHNGIEWQETEFGSKITSDIEVSVDFEDVIISFGDFNMESADIDSLQIISRINTSSTTLRIDSITVDNN